MNVAVFLPNWLGDLAMATPALRALRRHFPPPATITGILRPHLSDLLAGTSFLDDQWQFDPKGRPGSLSRWGLVRQMRRRRFDLAVLLTNSFHTAALAWLGGARRRLGYARDGRGWLLTDRVAVLRENGRIVRRPTVVDYLELAEAAGCGQESPRLELAITGQERALADAIWTKFALRDGRVIALNSSGAYGAAKLWPAEHFAALARRIAQTLDHDVLIICGPQEREVARAITAGAAHERVFSLADEAIGLGLSKGCLERVRLVVSTDSGPRHIAAALGKPVITLFGPTLQIVVENPTVRGENLQLDLDCIGCYARTCPLGHHRCMQELLPEQVFTAVERQLAL